MKLRTVIMSALLAGGFFTLTLQAQLIHEEGALRGARRAENERENFELVNNSNADVYYSVGVENNPTLRAQNFRLRQLRPLGIRAGVVPTNQRVEVIATRQEPQKRTYTVRLFSFTPGKDIFVQTVNRGGVIYIEPQSRRYGLFGSSATGRDLSNNVTQNDIRSRDIDYTPIANILLDPSATVDDLRKLDVKPEAIATVHSTIIDELVRTDASQEQIKRVNNLVNQYYQQIPETRPTQPVVPSPTPGQIFVPTRPVIPAPTPIVSEQQKNLKALQERFNIGGTLLQMLGLLPGASFDAVNKATKDARVLIENSNLSNDERRTLILKLQDAVQKYVHPTAPAAPVPTTVSPQQQALNDLIERIRAGKTIFDMLGIPNSTSPETVRQRANEAIKFLANNPAPLTILQNKLDQYLKSQSAITTPTQPSPLVPATQVQPATPARPEAMPSDPGQIPLSNQEMQRIINSTTILDINQNITPENVDRNYRLFSDRIEATPRSEQIKKILHNVLDSAYQKYLKDIAPRTSPEVAPEAQIPTSPGTLPVSPVTLTPAAQSPIVTPEPAIPVRHGTTRVLVVPPIKIPAEQSPAVTPEQRIRPSIGTSQVQIEQSNLFEKEIRDIINRIEGIGSDIDLPSESLEAISANLREISSIINNLLSIVREGTQTPANLRDYLADLIAEITERIQRVTTIFNSISRDISDEDFDRISDSIKQLSARVSSFINFIVSEQPGSSGQPAPQPRASTQQPTTPAVQPRPATQPPRSIPEAQELSTIEIQKIIKADVASQVTGQIVDRITQMRTLSNLIRRAENTNLAENVKQQVIAKLRSFYDKISQQATQQELGGLDHQLHLLRDKNRPENEKKAIINRLVDRYVNRVTTERPNEILQIRPNATVAEAENRFNELQQDIDDLITPLDQYNARLLINKLEAVTQSHIPS